MHLLKGESMFSHLVRISRISAASAVDAAISIAFPGHRKSSNILIYPHSRTGMKKALRDPYTRHYLLQTTELPLLINLYPGSDLTRERMLNAPEGILDGLLDMIRRPARVGMCDRCVSEQLRAEGVSWWLRDHAIAGVVVCTMHNVMLKQVPVDVVVRGAGLLPHEDADSFKSTNCGMSEGRQSIHALNYAHAVAHILRRRSRLPYTRIVRSVFDAIEQNLHLTGDKSKYSHARNPAKMAFVERLLSEGSQENFDVLGLGPMSLGMQTQRLVAGYGYSWMLAIHAALMFFLTHKKVIKIGE